MRRMKSKGFTHTTATHLTPDDLHVTPDDPHVTPDDPHVTPGLTRGPCIVSHPQESKWVPGQARNDEVFQ